MYDQEDDFYRPVGKEGEDVVEDSEEEDTQVDLACCLSCASYSTLTSNIVAGSSLVLRMALIRS